MRFFPWMLITLGLFLIGCDVAVQTESGKPMENCAQLDSLFQDIRVMDEALLENKDWGNCLALLDKSLLGLEANQQVEGKPCDYLDQRFLPDEPRLLFVESLRDRIESDTISQGIYYLLRFRGVFKEDAEISEFFSEELAHIALRNPACYLEYVRQNPDQEVMLLYSTKWNPLDLDTLLSGFEPLDSGGTVVAFLQNLKVEQENGI